MVVRPEDLAHLPLVDVHCHPFLELGALTADQLVDAMAFPGGGVEYMEEAGLSAAAGLHGEIQEIRRSTVYWRYALLRLAELFDCAADVDAVAASRNRSVAAGCRDHVRRLFSAVGLTSIVADFGYPQPPVDRSSFTAAMPCEVVPIFRI